VRSDRQTENATNTSEQPSTRNTTKAACTCATYEEWKNHLVWNSLPQAVISDLTVTTGTFKNRLKSALYGRAFLQ